MGAGAGLNSNTQNKQLEKDKRNNVSGYDDAVKCGKKSCKNGRVCYMQQVII